MSAELTEKKSPRGKTIARVLYHVFPSLFAFGLVSFARMSFWPSVILFGITACADGLRLLSVLSDRVENSLYKLFSGRMTKRGYWCLFLIYPSIGLASLVPYFFLPNLCFETANIFVAEYFPGAWKGIYRIGPPCSFPRGTVILITPVLLQITAILTLATCSFFVAISDKEYYYNLPTKSVIPIYSEKGEGLAKIYCFSGARFFYLSNLYTKYSFSLIFFIFLNFIAIVFPHSMWTLTPLPFNTNLIWYIYIYIAGSSVSSFVLTGGFILLSDSSPKAWYTKLKPLIKSEGKIQ